MFSMTWRVDFTEESSAGTTTKVRCASATGWRKSSLSSVLGGYATALSRLTTARETSESGMSPNTTSTSTPGAEAP